MEIFLHCPHCNGIIEITELNCGIFRHGIYKDSNEQMNPHSSKEICENAIITNKIYGCGKPFRVVSNNETYNAIKCDFI